MPAFTKELRQQIVQEFAVRHNGQFDPALFLAEVKEKGEAHLAYAWFEWDTNTAALKYQVDQAREFARGLRVKFQVEEIGRDKVMRVREMEAPMVLSPIGGRKDGGGYILVDPGNVDHIAELCREAAMALRAWEDRYQAALAHAGAAKLAIGSALAALDRASPRKEEAA